MFGMLWYDKDPNKTLETKIREAAKYYQEKYGVYPDTVFAPIDAEGKAPAGIILHTSRSIQKNHFLIGKDSQRWGGN